MSEQSNKPSPSPARAASPNRNPNQPRKDAGSANTRAPLTKTPELQAKPERVHREAGERRGGDGRQGGGRNPRGALANALAQAKVRAPASAPQERKAGDGERRQRDEKRNDQPRGERKPPMRTPLPAITFPEDLPVSG